VTLDERSNVRSVKRIEVIRVESLCGHGVEGSPFRPLVEYYSLDGDLLATRDEWRESHNHGAGGDE
jgi:hypothetical protein